MADRAEIERIIDQALEDLMSALDKIGATPAEVRLADSEQIADWYEDWLPEPTPEGA